VDGDAARPELLDPFGEDVADDDVVPEVGEARAGDEADVAGAEDRNAGHGYFFAAFPAVPAFRGCSPFAIAIIVSFESVSESVLITQ
jgi:hypothetical protein